MSDSSLSQTNSEAIEDESAKVIRCRALIKSYVEPFLSSHSDADEFELGSMLTITLATCSASKKAVELECELIRQNGHSVAFTGSTTDRITMEIQQGEAMLD